MTDERPKRPILSLKPGARTSLPDFPTPPLIDKLRARPGKKPAPAKPALSPRRPRDPR